MPLYLCGVSCGDCYVSYAVLLWDFDLCCLLFLLGWFCIDYLIRGLIVVVFGILDDFVYY